MEPSFEHIVSCGAYGEIANGTYERMREAKREVWFGSDGSGLIEESWLRSSFFTAEQRERWETAPRRDARETPTPSMDLFAAGCLPGHGLTLSKLPLDVSALFATLQSQRRLTLQAIGELIGEALVEKTLRRALYDLAARLPGADVLLNAADEHGQAGIGIARIERGTRTELIFNPHTLELLGKRYVLTDPTDYAPSGSLVGWSSYLSRETVDSLPERTPPVPALPCVPPGRGRGTRIEPGFVLSTGGFTDLASQLTDWRENGVITNAQYDAVTERS